MEGEKGKWDGIKRYGDINLLYHIWYAQSIHAVLYADADAWWQDPARSLTCEGEKE